MRYLVIALALLAGCGRLNFDPFGSLVVSTTEDRMAGPPTLASLDELPPEITDLSLREALAIAANNPGPDRIEFDAQVFPVTAPAVIRLGSTLELAGNATTVDATGRGVVIDDAAGFAGTLIHISTNGDGARLIKLAMRGGSAVRVFVDSVTDVEVVDTTFAVSRAIAVRIFNSRACALRRVTIQDPMGNAVEIERATGVSIEDTSITRTLADPITAKDSTDLVIQGNTIVIDPTSTTGRGVVFDMVDNSRIENNFIDPGSARLIELQDSSNNEIVGNVLEGGDVGIGLFAASINNLVFRNIITNSAEAMYVDTLATGNRLFHNTMYMSGSLGDAAPDTQLVNNLEADLGFVDPARYDFHLAAGSQWIDRGTDLGLDLLPDRSERFLGAAPDLGAVETN